MSEDLFHSGIRSSRSLDNDPSLLHDYSVEDYSDTEQPSVYSLGDR